ncbi:MAG: hypothetical protein INR71_08880 [Terriglobus roseus]|nr:hypothetical protein [Terriglobus roseus]
MDRLHHDKAKGLPIHHRTPSYLDYAREAMATISDGEDDQDANGYMSSPVGPQYSYHHGATDDDLPTPAYTPLTKSKRPSAKVRRVSRVWLWNGSHEGRDTWVNAPPALRFMRRTLMTAARPVSTFATSLVRSEPVQEMWQVLWPALSLAVVVWVWHW